MAKREQYGAAVECHLCKKKGSATWEENENPVHGGGLDRVLLEVPVGFHRGNGTDVAGDTEIICDECKVAC